MADNCRKENAAHSVGNGAPSSSEEGVIFFTLDVEPKSLQFGGKRLNTKPCRYGKRPIFYQDKKAEEYQSMVYALAVEHRPANPITGAVELRMAFVLPRPQNAPKSIPGLIRHTKRPDYDNLIKGTQDALSAVGFWLDDAQISDSHITKRYAEIGGPARICVSIRELHLDAGNNEVIGDLRKRVIRKPRIWDSDETRRFQNLKPF